MDRCLTDIPAGSLAAFGRSHRRLCVEGKVDIADREPAKHVNLRAGEVFITEVLSMATVKLRDMQFCCQHSVASLFL